MFRPETDSQISKNWTNYLTVQIPTATAPSTGSSLTMLQEAEAEEGLSLQLSMLEEEEAIGFEIMIIVKKISWVYKKDVFDIWNFVFAHIRINLKFPQ